MYWLASVRQLLNGCVSHIYFCVFHKVAWWSRVPTSLSAVRPAARDTERQGSEFTAATVTTAILKASPLRCQDSAFGCCLFCYFCTDFFFHRTHRQPDHANKNPFSIQMPTKCQKDCLFSHLMSSYWSLLHLTLVNVFIGVQDIKKMLHTEQWSNAYEPYKYISQLAASLMADRHGPVC